MTDGSTDGWAVAGVLIGIAGLLVAGATLILVILDRAEKGRRLRGVVWNFHHVSSVQNSGKTIALNVELTNQGTSPAIVSLLMLVGANTIVENNPLPPASIAPHVPATFMIEPVNPETVWLLIGYLDTNDGRYAGFEWMPLVMTGPLGVEHIKQQEERWKKKRRRLRKTPPQRPVGPGGVEHASIKGVKLETAAQIKAVTATAVAEKGQSLR